MNCPGLGISWEAIRMILVFWFMIFQQDPFVSPVSQFLDFTVPVLIGCLSVFLMLVYCLLDIYKFIN